MHLRALTALNESEEQWDSILICVLTSKLDRTTDWDWEKSLTGKNMPKLEILLEFLQNLYQFLEALLFDTTAKCQSQFQTANNSKKQSLAVTQLQDFCNFCKGNYKINGCEKIKATPATKRRNAVQTAGLCFNCLCKGHRNSE